jgi:peptidoglycan/xylan/chitin deacetylase (PgdA/CDA1 family)
MPRYWNWDFEDERAKHRPPPPPPPPAPPEASARAAPRAGDPDRLAQIRRRRFGAAALAVVLLVVIVAALSGAHHRDSAAVAAARADMAHARHARSHQANKPENDQRSAIASVLAYTPFVKEGGVRNREIALTFDDGPGPYTPQVLSVLEHYHVHATFFVVGRMLRYFSASAVREVEDGDVIGDHTENHPMLGQLSAHDQREELFEQIARVELIGARRPTLFRPPYGSFNATTWRELRALHLLMVLWSVDTNDYAQPGVEAIVQRALAGAHPGAIILMHDAGGTRTQTVAALPQIISGLRSRGYTLVTVPRLLMDDPPPAGQQVPTNLSGD